MGFWFISCGYYDPVTPDNLQRPFKDLPDPSYDGYTKLNFGSIILQMSLNDYINVCHEQVRYMDAGINEIQGFSRRIHYLSTGLVNPEFNDPIYLTVMIDQDEFTGDDEILAIHSFNFNGFNYREEDFILIPESYMDNEDHAVKLILNSLEIHFIVGKR